MSRHDVLGRRGHRAGLAGRADRRSAGGFRCRRLPARDAGGLEPAGRPARAREVAVSPDPRARQAVALVQGDPALHLIATDALGTSAQPLGLPSGSAPEALALSGDGHGLFVVAAGASHDLSLLVLAWRDPGWASVQTLPLYRAADSGRPLLRATPDGATLFLASTASAQVTLSGSPVDLAVLPDGSAAYLLSAESPDVIRYGGEDQPHAAAFTSEPGYKTEFITDIPTRPDECVYVRAGLRNRFLAISDAGTRLAELEQHHAWPRTRPMPLAKPVRLLAGLGALIEERPAHDKGEC